MTACAISRVALHFKAGFRASELSRRTEEYCAASWLRKHPHVKLRHRCCGSAGFYRLSNYLIGIWRMSTWALLKHRRRAVPDMKATSARRKGDIPGEELFFTVLAVRRGCRTAVRMNEAAATFSTVRENVASAFGDISPI